MISVATLTYRREHILEEAIQSFVLQDRPDCEMVVLNDCCDVKYETDIPNVRIINTESRFPSIGEKLRYCFSQCSNPFLYRLDDDDLLSEGGLSIMMDAIMTNPGYDVYRAKSAHFLSNNENLSVSDNINNGNCYSKGYIKTIRKWDYSCNEDVYITYRNNARIFQFEEKTMIYRWGMGTYHISGLGVDKEHKDYLEVADRLGSDTINNYRIEPHFKNDYYKKIREGNK